MHSVLIIIHMYSRKTAAYLPALLVGDFRRKSLTCPRIGAIPRCAIFFGTAPIINYIWYVCKYQMLNIVLLHKTSSGHLLKVFTYYGEI